MLDLSRSKVVGVLLFCAFSVLAFRLRQRDLEFLIQPDFNWQLVEAWRIFLSTLNDSRLPVPYPHAYLDGQFIIYALGDIMLRFSADHVSFLQPHFPNDLSFALGTALLVNTLAYAGAGAIFFAAYYRLTDRVSIAAVLAIGWFLTPQMLDIDLGRVDFLVTLPLAIIFYCSLVLAIKEEETTHAAALGAAMALAATIKINGLFFVVFPALAVLTTFRLEQTTTLRLAKFTAVSLASFLVLYVLLMFRYLYYLSPSGILPHYQASLVLELQWAHLLTRSLLYYNIDLMKGSGWGFILLYLACAAYVVAAAIVKRSSRDVYFALCFFCLSAAGAFTQKYPRGGYHLLPVFLAGIAIAAGRLLDATGHPYVRRCLLAAGGVAFALTLWVSATWYGSIVTTRRIETGSLLALKRAPRDWLQDHVPAGTTICVQTDSEWTLPPLNRFNVDYGPLALPYLDNAALARSEPPDISQIAAACPLIVTSDWHRDFFANRIKEASPETEQKWQIFFQKLDDRYPPIVFSSVVPLVAKAVYINDLR